MTDLYTPEKRTIGELLNGQAQLVLPPYQRDYSWTANEYEAFWNDLVAFSERYPGSTIQRQEYFMGSVVLVPDGGTKLILDGQQRLTTAAILLSAVRDAVASESPGAASDISRDFLRWVDSLNPTNTRDRLVLSDADRDFFRQEILEPVSKTRPVASLPSHQRIRKARKFFDARILELLTRPSLTGQDAVRSVFRLADVLTKYFTLVVINSRDEDSAAEVFETLNDRGLSLSTADLIQNLILRSTPASQRDEAKRLWSQMKGKLGTVRAEQFLRHFWVSRRGDVKSKSLFRAIKDAFKSEGTDGLLFARDLVVEAAGYIAIVRHDVKDPELRALYKEAQVLGARSLLPALISAAALPDSEQRVAVELLTSLYFRHTFVCGRENDELESVVYRAAKSMREDGNASAAIVAIRSMMPSDADFAAAFAGLSLPNTKQQRHILSRLELTAAGNGEHAISHRITVEHIYPQTPAEGAWPDHDDWISRLGNLTLLSRPLNSTAKNAAFSVKCPIYARSKITLTSKLSSMREWTPATIEERQRELAAIAVATWK